MRGILKSRIAWLSVLPATLAGMLLTASPAAAYNNGNIHSHHAIIDTDDAADCRVMFSNFPSGRYIYEDGSQCVFPDLPGQADGTYFVQQPNGEAAKYELHTTDGTLLAKVEFHPYDEELWVYDTENDGDTIYVTFSDGEDIQQLVSPPGTSRGIDTEIVDFDIPEGRDVTVRVFDDPNLTDQLGVFFPKT